MTKKRKVHGTKERPRLSVYRSLKHMHAQIISDEEGKTLVSASTCEGKIRKLLKGGGNIAAAKAIGEEIAKRAISQGIKKVVFDRGDFLYHGRTKALADAARAGGLEF